MELPPSFPSDGVFFVEPKFGQGEPCCFPQVVEAKNNKIKVVIKENSSCAPVKLIKNSKPVQIREAKLDLNSNEQFSEPSVRYYDKFKDTIPARKKEIDERYN